MKKLNTILEKQDLDRAEVLIDYSIQIQNEREKIKKGQKDIVNKNFNTARDWKRITERRISRQAKDSTNKNSEASKRRIEIEE